MAIKTHFIPRHPDCIFIEADYSQLEIRVLALASNCPALISDLNNGVDIHRLFAAEIYGKERADVTAEERRKAKGFSFQMQYGASAHSIATYWNVPIAEVKTFMDKYFARYPEIKAWQDNNISSVMRDAAFTGAVSTVTNPPTSVESSVIPAIWPGSKLGQFVIDAKIYDGSGPRRDPVFPKTQIKNYPIQGGAADITLLMMNKMRKELMVHPCLDDTLFLGTVHDSFLFESRHQGSAEACKHIKNFLEGVPTLLEEQFEIVCPISFPVELKTGANWGDMHPLTTL